MIMSKILLDGSVHEQPTHACSYNGINNKPLNYLTEGNIQV